MVLLRNLNPRAKKNPIANEKTYEGENESLKSFFVTERTYRNGGLLHLQ